MKICELNKTIIQYPNVPKIQYLLFLGYLEWFLNFLLERKHSEYGFNKSRLIAHYPMTGWNTDLNNDNFPSWLQKLETSFKKAGYKNSEKIKTNVQFFLDSITKMNYSNKMKGLNWEIPNHPIDDETYYKCLCSLLYILFDYDITNNYGLIAKNLLTEGKKDIIGRISWGCISSCRGKDKYNVILKRNSYFTVGNLKIVNPLLAIFENELYFVAKGKFRGRLTSKNSIRVSECYDLYSPFMKKLFTYTRTDVANPKLKDELIKLKRMRSST
jgi:hypothetical protein